MHIYLKVGTVLLFSLSFLWAEQLKDLNLQSLMEVDVESFSKHKQKLSEIPGAITVLTQDEIRATGAKRLQDLFDRVPGAFSSDISYWNSKKGIRDVPDFYATSILWLLDGVVMNSYINAGINLQYFELPIEAIDRVEFIRGGAGTIHGANAATGVVAVYTRKPGDYEGWGVSVDGAFPGTASIFVHHDQDFGDRFSQSIWVSAKRSQGYGENPIFSEDSLHIIRNQIGPTTLAVLPDDFTDTTVENPFTHRDNLFSDRYAGSWKLSADFGESNQLLWNNFSSWVWINNYGKHWESGASQVEYPFDKSWGWWGLSSLRWDHQFSKNNSFFIRAFHQSNYLESVASDYFLSGSRLSDLEYSHSFSVWKQNLNWGGDFRRVDFDIGRQHGNIHFFEPQNTEYLYSAYLRNDFPIVNHVRGMLGIKAETWTLLSSDPEWLPDARISWKPAKKVFLWGGWNRSISTPGYNLTNLELRLQPPPFPVADWIAVLSPNELKPTSYWNTEIGMRLGTWNHFKYEANWYKTIIKNQIGEDQSKMFNFVNSKIDHAKLMPVYYGNFVDGDIDGIEVLLEWKPSSNFHNELSYSRMVDMISENWRGEDADKVHPYVQNPGPEHQIRLHNHWKFGSGWVFGSLFQWTSSYNRGDPYNYLNSTAALVDQLEGTYADKPSQRFRLDLSLQKEFPLLNTNIQLWGRDLLQGTRIEDYDAFAVRYPMPVRATWGVTLRSEF